MEKLNEIVELGNAQDLILGAPKDFGGNDSGMGSFRLEVTDGEEDE